MDIHKNAPADRVWSRADCASVLGGQTPKAVALAAGACPRIVRKWVVRYQAEGLVGLRGPQLTASSIAPPDTSRCSPKDRPEEQQASVSSEVRI